MRKSDLVSVCPFPTVVHHGDLRGVRDLLDADPEARSSEASDALRAWVAQYFVEEGHNRLAVDTLLEALALRPERGQGFLLNGVYGSGKSHLLAVLTLLCRHPAAWRFFLHGHPDYERHSASFLGAQKLLVTTFSLDEYSGRRDDLESIFWKETWLEWQRCSPTPPRRWEAPGDEPGHPRSRAETFAEFTRDLRASSFRGAVWIVDELAAFLGSRDHAGLQHDASFLQFLGQRFSSGTYWFIGALQKTIEDVGDIEPYILGQVKGRFHTHLVLSATQAKSVVARKLVRKHDPAKFDGFIGELDASLRRRFPRWRYGRGDLTASYPFHPATLQLLERVSDRFFSRSRSVVSFVTEALLGTGATSASPLDSPAEALVPPDAVYDYFQPDIALQPELRAYHDRVVRYYQENAARLLSEDEATVLRLAKLLVLQKMAGQEGVADEIAEALLPELDLPGEGVYGYVQYALERFHSDGSYVAAVRQPGLFHDRYAVDLGFKLSESVRRRMATAVAAYDPRDSRIERSALDCCTRDDWPLARLTAPIVHSCWWLNTERKVGAELLAPQQLTSGLLVNRVALLADPGTAEDVQLFVGSFFDPDGQRERWIGASREVEVPRWGDALALLLPRVANDSELRKLTEVTAAQSLLRDPTLTDNRRGLAIIEHIKEQLPLHESEARRIVKRLFLEGEVLLGKQTAFAVSELIGEKQTWDELVEAIAAAMLERVFPQFPPVAPRVRGPSGGTLDMLTDWLLRQSSAPLTAAQQRLIRAIGVPLGVAKESRGQLLFSAPEGERVEETSRSLESVRALSPSAPGAAYQQVVALLRKSSFGLPEWATQLVIAALLREGRCVALKADGSALAFDALTSPFSQCIAFLTPGRLLTAKEWAEVVALPDALGIRADLRRHDLAEQEHLWREVLAWKRETTGLAELTQARATHLRRNLRQEDFQWERLTRCLRLITEVLHGVNDSESSAEGLVRLASLLTPSAEGGAVRSRAICDFAFWLERTEKDAEFLSRCYVCLTNQDLVLPEEGLQRQREGLLERLSTGDQCLAEAPAFRQSWEEFWESYSESYRRFHAATHGAEHLEPYTRLALSTTFKALTAVGELRVVDGARGREVWTRLRKVLAGRCDAADLHRELTPWMPVCPRCRLILGQKPLRPPVVELQNEAAEALRPYQEWIGAAATRETMSWRAEALTDPGLSRSLKALAELPTPAEATSLAQLMTPRVVEELNFLFAGRREVRRNLRDLAARLAGRKITKAEATREFETWIESGEQVRPDDWICVETEG